jgi:hypothetical protein
MEERHPARAAERRNRFRRERAWILQAKGFKAQTKV